MAEKISQKDIRPKTLTLDDKPKAKSVNPSDIDLGSLTAEISGSIATKGALERSISDWRTILTKECQVYVIGEQYIAKRFDQIHYKYMGKDEAKEILIDNLYAILLYKYFPKVTDEVLDRINTIVKGLTANIKSFLTKITLDDDYSTSGLKMQRVPNTAVAFANGIFDFKENRFITMYERIYVENINNTIILYGNYIIFWNFDFNFTPWPVNINEISFEDFIKVQKEVNDESVIKNYCFELFYNLSHDIDHKPSLKRMTHLAEIFGYTLTPQFLQYFVMLIGSGQNGKNSLFDGCFSARVVPKPVSNSIESIEKDRFITESLQNACHNIFLETSPKTYTDSNMLKALTGSPYQTIECKGVGKYAGVINCKYIFAGNDQANIKFSDATPGFRRRINLFEIFYQWDADHRFTNYGDYYVTDFSQDLHEIKNDINNAMMYIYLGMYGVISATRNGTRDFKFSHNEWNEAYSDVDLDMKDYFNNIAKPIDFYKYLGDTRYTDLEHLKIAFFSEDEERLYMSKCIKDYHVFTFDEMCRFFNATTEKTAIASNGDEIKITVSNFEEFMRDNDVYISLVYLRSMLNRVATNQKTQREFNDMFKKLYPYVRLVPLCHREQYVKCRLIKGKVRFLDK